MTILYVFIGGGVGSVVRYLISLWSAPLNGAMHFPVGTLICNLLGCVLIGMFNGMATRMGWDNELKLMLTVGLCGGFTTFSTFSNESLAMLSGGQYASYALYLALSIVFGILCVWFGMKL